MRVAHPNPEEMTTNLCILMTELDPVTDPGVVMIVHPHYCTTYFDLLFKKMNVKYILYQSFNTSIILGSVTKK